MTPRGMRADDAASYLGMSVTKFRELVDSKRMPKSFKVDGIVLWDRLDLDAAFDDLKRGGRPNTINERLGMA